MTELEIKVRYVDGEITAEVEWDVDEEFFQDFDNDAEFYQLLDDLGDRFMKIVKK